MNNNTSDKIFLKHMTDAIQCTIQPIQDQDDETLLKSMALQSIALNTVFHSMLQRAVSTKNTEAEFECIRSALLTQRQYRRIAHDIKSAIEKNQLQTFNWSK